MDNKISVYHFGAYERDTTNGMFRVIYSYGQLVSGHFNFNTIGFKQSWAAGKYARNQVGDVTVHTFGKKYMFGLLLPKPFRRFLLSAPKNSVFHLHGAFRRTNIVLSYMIRKSGHAYVLSPHNPYEGLLKRMAYLKKPYMWIYSRTVIQNAAAVHAITPQEVPYLERCGASKVMVVPNPVLSTASDHRPQRAPSEGTIGFLGRLDIFQKGIDVMLRAVKEVIEHTDQSIQFVIAGESSPRQAKQFHRLCQQLDLDLDNEVTLAGRLFDDQKAEFFGRCRLYLHLSRFEGFGLAVVEALEQGVPVVVSRGVPIPVDDSDFPAGIIVDDASAAAEAIIKIMNLSDTDYARLCDNARKLYEKMYSPKAIEKRIVELYEYAASTRSGVQGSS